MTQSSRRTFLQSVGSAAAASAVWHLNPAPAQASRSPLEKLNVAAIGTGNRAAKDIAGCETENIAALVDIDADFLNAASNKYPGARTYEDFRVMLEKEGDRIDAVIVGTPDHTHAVAAAMAMKMGKHVYCEKPLTHTVYEARRLAELAAEHKLTTQMGTQIHAGNNYRRVVEAVQSGAIGPVKEVHVWVGVDYSGGVQKPAQKPESVNWDLWLGPVADHEYVECTIKDKPEKVHPFFWRWFWKFGSGGLGDFGCHYMDLAHWALKLHHPTRISASGPPVDDTAATAGIVVDYEYPARGDMPPVRMTWYDGGKRPEALSRYRDADGKPLDWKSGQLFVGERGAIISNYSQHVLLPHAGQKITAPEPWLPDSIGHHQEWLQAIRTDGKTTCNFDYSGALTEAVLLGVVSYRTGEAIDWDGKNFKAKNSPTAQQMLHKEYRSGWTL